MDGYPLEIQMLIFEFACTDGGSAGRALALVSRAVRALSYPYQWNSLAIYGYGQAAGFAKLLYSQQPALGLPHRPVHHLFVSSRPAQHAVDYNHFHMPHTWPGVVRGILRHAAPTLRTLAMISLEAPMDSAIILSQALSLHYPCLVELTIRGRCTPEQLEQAKRYYVVATAAVADEEANDAVWPSIPSLRRLHLVCAFNGLGRSTRPEHALIHQLAPSLTHLRFTVLDLWGSKRIAEIVHAECAQSGIMDPYIELGDPSSPNVASGSSTVRPYPTRPLVTRIPHSATPLATQPTFNPSGPLLKASRVTWDRVLPPAETLELFVFQPPPVSNTDFYCSCCMDARGDRDVMRVFEALARASDGRFLYLPSRVRTVYGFEEAEADWLDRVKGLQGCWAARQEVPVHRAAVAAAVSPASPASQPVLDRRASGKRKRVTLKSVVKRLQKVKFW
ncbi:uncharacterized protein TRAVEDRAFT_71313 [Trametes versicolor FP-101664 SS1]|uniref:uncharacterized protein n=1 Tax=Trametes versicolor (strain FP-101664) TaxID=717944 RepID=UPI0004623670|nr:uncharacterized protein TRAVEDRAFT_71313 [Trametes versicolor FP-101664 SS1]EIW59133.1 hypothetical protein TRAVEDRAFT_71313 [Trametes versicolor FP-101664 SS1]